MIMTNNVIIVVINMAYDVILIVMITINDVTIDFIVIMIIMTIK